MSIEGTAFPAILGVCASQWAETPVRYASDGSEAKTG